MLKVIVLIGVGALVAGLFARRALRSRREHADTTPELHQHPERLEQNLDSSDDA
jgi:hypothetical protein